METVAGDEEAGEGVGVEAEGGAAQLGIETNGIAEGTGAGKGDDHGVPGDDIAVRHSLEEAAGGAEEA